MSPKSYSNTPCAEAGEGRRVDGLEGYPNPTHRGREAGWMPKKPTLTPPHPHTAAYLGEGGACLRLHSADDGAHLARQLLPGGSTGQQHSALSASAVRLCCAGHRAAEWQAQPAVQQRAQLQALPTVFTATRPRPSCFACLRNGKARPPKLEPPPVQPTSRSGVSPSMALRWRRKPGAHVSAANTHT